MSLNDMHLTGFDHKSPIAPRRIVLPLVVMGVALFTSLVPLRASGFHDGGVASCSGCHVMHVTEDGLPVDPASPFGNDMDLIYGSVAEVCLSCHAQSNGAVFSSDPLAPSPELGAGNFTFLQEDNINDAIGGMELAVSGVHAGHSIVAPSEGVSSDPVNIVSPGGSYPSNELTCTSCHDPHGTDSFRMLRGQGSTDATGFVFLTSAPTAEGIELYFSQESRTYHTAYQSGWSDWCGNCHGNNFHATDGTTSFDHPSNVILEAEYANNYNAYDGPAAITTGDYTTAYLPDVPLEDPSYTRSSTVGANAGSRISCMTCHRAHATSAIASGRWDSTVRFLSYDGMESGSYPIPDPYASSNQRPLCVKCHVAQVSQHGSGRGCTDCH